MSSPRIFRLVATWALLIAVGGSAWSCRSQPAAREPMTPEAFAKVFVELRRADAESDSVQQFDARKQEILDQNGVTPDELREFVREYSRHPQQMADLWDTIEAHLRNPPKDSLVRDTLPAPSTGRRPPAMPRRDTLHRPEPSRRPDTLRRPGALHRPDTFRRPGAPPPTPHR